MLLSLFPKEAKEHFALSLSLQRLSLFSLVQRASLMPEPRPPGAAAAARPIQIGGGGSGGAHGSSSASAAAASNSSSSAAAAAKPSPPPSVSAAAAALLIFSPSPPGSGLASSPSSSSSSAWGVGTPPELQSVFRPTAGGDEGGAATHSLVSFFFDCSFIRRGL